MKKRSLVAAIAMLVVSAIVLTSATYAWFAANTSANIQTFTADVGNAAGSLYISTTGQSGSWRSSLTASDFTSGIATSLVPVSYDKEGDHFYGGGFTDSNNDGKAIEFTGTATATATNYTAITVYVYTETNGTVTVTPTLSAIGGTPYVYASVKSATDQKILGTAGDSYYPIKVVNNATQGSANDNAAAPDGIIDATEITTATDLELGTQVSVDNTTSITLNMTAGEANAQQVTFYVWAEGQDSNCVGTSQGAPEFGVSFSFAGAASSSNNG